MLKLSEVTIWTIVWDEDRKWIVKAGQVLRYCRSLIEPARMILFTHGRVADRDYPFEVVNIPQLNWQSYNIFVNRVVPTYIKSGFAMSVHEDGFPLDASLWRSEFLDYDYIGAPWSDGVVGNGGFNIESRKLMDVKAAMAVTAQDFSTASDRLVCTVWRQELEARGIRFAPPAVAIAFSTEQVGNEHPSFGFHGRGPAAEKYRQGWRLIQAAASVHAVEVIQPPRAQPVQPVREHQGFFMQGNRVVPAPARGMAAPQPTVPTPPPSVDLVYVYVPHSQRYDGEAERFISSYQAFPPGYEHSTVIMCNGDWPPMDLKKRFGELPNCRFQLHDNSGQDIGAFIAAAKCCRADMQVCLGSSVHFFRSGWLKRMVEPWQTYGPGVYASQSSFECTVHFNTTGFWCPPKLLTDYPFPVVSKEDRYNFEHGRANKSRNLAMPDRHRDRAFWKMAYRSKVPVLLVTWDGEYRWWDWRKPPNILRKGNQSNLLLWWKHADEWFTFPPGAKRISTQTTDLVSDPDFSLMSRTFR
jgi:hypothetical protein